MLSQSRAEHQRRPPPAGATATAPEPLVPSSPSAICGDDGANEAHGDIPIGLPGADVDIIAHRDRNDLAVCRGHGARHGAAHAAQRFHGADFLQDARYALDIF